jgi:hypothetical protein
LKKNKNGKFRKSVVSLCPCANRDRQLVSLLRVFILLLFSAAAAAVIAAATTAAAAAAVGSSKPEMKKNYKLTIAVQLK